MTLQMDIARRRAPLDKAILAIESIFLYIYIS
jgi:hypothetical protein